MTAFRIPDCCAFPLQSKVGDTYTCITCSTVYRHLIGGWTLSGPIVDLAPELEMVENPVWHGVRYPEGTPEYADYAARLRAELAKFAAGEHPYEITLDESERTDH